MSEKVGALTSPDIRWQIEQRVRFIEARAYWVGLINRQDLMRRFGISINQATQDFNRYQALAPDNLVYDRRARTYVAAPKFLARLGGDDAEALLREVHLKASGVMAPGDGVLDCLPDVALAASPARAVPSSILRPILSAILNRRVVRIAYQSMARPESDERSIEPHALAWDGFRWHVRAWCHQRSDFRDFVIGRIDSVVIEDAGSADFNLDTTWHQIVRVVVAPHPGLSAAQARAIERDYQMVQGIAVIDTRAALLFYTLRRLGLDVDPAARRPDMQQIVLVNRSEIEALAPHAFAKPAA